MPGARAPPLSAGTSRDPPGPWTGRCEGVWKGQTLCLLEDALCPVCPGPRELRWSGGDIEGQGSAAVLGGAHVALGVPVPRALVGPPGGERQGLPFASSERRPSCGIAEVGVTCGGFSAAGLRAVGALRGPRPCHPHSGSPLGPALALPWRPQLVLPKAKLLDLGRHGGAPVGQPCRRAGAAVDPWRRGTGDQARLGALPGVPQPWRTLGPRRRVQQVTWAPHGATAHLAGQAPPPGRCNLWGRPHVLPGPQGTELTIWGALPTLRFHSCGSCAYLQGMVC